MDVIIPQGFKVHSLGKPYGLLPLQTGIDGNGVDLEVKYRQASHPYKILLESEDKDAVILLPVIPDAEYVQVVKRGYYIESELRAVKNDPGLDISNMIAPVYNSNPNQYANADTVVIYDIDLSNAHVDGYKYCTALYLRKFAHPAMCMKILFTENGRKKKKLYIDRLMSSIRFGDNPNEVLVNQEQNNSLNDLVFPQTTGDAGTGIRYSKVDNALMSIYDKGGREAEEILMGARYARPYKTLIRKSGNKLGVVAEVDSVLRGLWDSGGSEAYDTLMNRIKRFDSEKSFKGAIGR